MSPEGIVRVRADLALIGPVSEEVGLSLYRRLFALDPSARNLFKNDLNAQAVHLMDALATVVGSLDDLDAIDSEIRGLALRHVDYQVREEQFASVGVALIATLEASLGEAFSPAAREAWTNAYEELAIRMIAAMKDAAVEALPN